MVLHKVIYTRDKVCKVRYLALVRKYRHMTGRMINSETDELLCGNVARETTDRVHGQQVEWFISRWKEFRLNVFFLFSTFCSPDRFRSF